MRWKTARRWSCRIQAASLVANDLTLDELRQLEARRMRDAGKAPAEIAEALAVSRMSVWRALNGRVV
jgi:DNA invertase Pin-like site-specific DNA recombinase